MYICEPPRKYTRVCVSKKRKKKKKFYSERRGEPILHIAGKVSRFFPLFFFLFLSIFFLFGFPRSWVIVEMLMAYSFLFSPSFSFFFSSCCCHPTKYRNVGVCMCVVTYFTSPTFPLCPVENAQLTRKKEEGRTKSISTHTPPINGQCSSVGSWFFSLFFLLLLFLTRRYIHKPKKSL